MFFLKERIYSLLRSSQLFFDSYICKFENEMPEKKFNKFRLYFLNLVTEVNI